MLGHVLGGLFSQTHLVALFAILGNFWSPVSRRFFEEFDAAKTPLLCTLPAAKGLRRVALPLFYLGNYIGTYVGMY
jgi:hypothetical protein